MGVNLLPVTGVIPLLVMGVPLPLALGAILVSAKIVTPVALAMEPLQVR